MDENEMEGEFDEVLERLGWQYSPPPPGPASISDECLSAAEEAAEQVVNCIQPTLESEDKRRDVIDHMQRLIKAQVDCQVFPYGSVPLKTYLPDGDIDLTAFQGPNADESFAHNVLAVIRAEERNQNAEYRVKDTQFIDAEVKLVKCVVRNFVVDISFNQLGGLSTLCFLEQIDRIVGRNHLFKRSIMLVKTWCYHESRILGAHYGLLSTYALETLVLYIFHMFHSSLSGPLAVLYRFLEYYSKFDWENYCISLKGPLCKSSLPNLVVKMPESEWSDWMLSEEFLDKCMEMYSVPLSVPEEKPKPFQPKCLNIIDPLKENNNLGRSVHRGNFYRIRSALKYGARKLGQVLQQPRDKVADDISDFFSCTISRHGYQQRSTFRHLAIESSDEDSTASLPVESYSNVDLLLESSTDYDDDSVGADEEYLDRFPTREVPSEMASESCYYADGVASSGNSEPYNLATNSSLTNGMSVYTSSSNYSASLDGKKSSAENASLGTGNSNQSDLADSASLNSWLHEEKKNEELNNTYKWCMDSSQAIHIACSDYTRKPPNTLENLTVDIKEMDLTSTGESESFNHLAELTGDYDCHVRSLLHGQLCRGFNVRPALAVQNSPSLPLNVQSSKKPWDIVRQSIPFVQNHFSQTTSHMVSMEQHGMYLDADSAALPATAFCSDWQQRGTGTYFPNANGFWQNDYMQNGFYMDRASQRWNRNAAPSNCNHFHRHDRSNVLYHHASDATNYYENNSHEILATQGRGRSVAHCQSPKSVRVKNPTKDCTSESLMIEFGSIGNLAKEVISGSANIRGSSQGASIRTQHTASVTKQEKVPVLPIHLKSDDEFPALCQSYA